MSRTRREVLDDIMAKQQQQRFDVATLAMWEEVERQGVNPLGVKSFGFSCEFLTPQENREYRRKHRAGQLRMVTREDGSRVVRPEWFNFYRNHQGEKVRLAVPADRDIVLHLELWSKVFRHLTCRGLHEQ
jgi:hypothetical protein